jgi:predicted GIY-YIG superfamily endonuclease
LDCGGKAVAAVCIAREKQIKGGSRQDKEALINRGNWLWRDLGEEL